MATGVFECGRCSERFHELIPPTWLDYWPSHCGEHAALDRMIDAQPSRCRSTSRKARLLTLSIAMTKTSIWVAMLVPGLLLQT